MIEIMFQASFVVSVGKRRTLISKGPTCNQVYLMVLYMRELVTGEGGLYVGFYGICIMA